MVILPHSLSNPKDFAGRPLREFSDWVVIWNKDEAHPAGFAEDYEYALENGLAPCILVPDTEEAYREAIELGCRMFTSDDPATAIQVLKGLGYRKTGNLYVQGGELI